MSDSRLETNLLLRAGRLLLEYNESSGAILNALSATARSLTDESCHFVVSYRGVAVALGGGGATLEPVSELRYNNAVQARVHDILALVRRGDLDAATALARLDKVEVDTPLHSRWLAALAIAAAAASLTVLLGADRTAAVVAGLSTGLGLLAKQELGSRQFAFLAQPLIAAFIGAVIGGLAIRLSWTRSPELVLIVPALMLVPGPHIINALLDLIDNHLPMCLFRLALASGILLASALGVLLGIELTLSDSVSIAKGHASSIQVNLFIDVILAGVVSCGFAMFYNTAKRELWMATAGGMLGHGLRFLALEGGARLETATLLGGLAVGAISAWFAGFRKIPVAVISFAGAVTMIPGLSLYRTLGGAWHLARRPDLADPGVVAATIAYAFQSCLVVGALALGLVLGARVVQSLSGRNEKKPSTSQPSNSMCQSN